MRRLTQPVIGGNYQRLVAAGKQKNVALVAYLLKMIVLLNVMVRDGTCWEDTKMMA